MTEQLARRVRSRVDVQVQQPVQEQRGVQHKASARQRLRPFKHVAARHRNHSIARYECTAVPCANGNNDRSVAACNSWAVDVRSSDASTQPSRKHDAKHSDDRRRLRVAIHSDERQVSGRLRRRIHSRAGSLVQLKDGKGCRWGNSRRVARKQSAV